MNRRIVFGLLLLTVVALGEIVLPVAGESGTQATALNGATLYYNNCYSCHGTNGIGTHIAPDIQGVSASDIQEAINEVPLMSGLKSLSNPDIKAIASFLDTFAGRTGGDD
jgi:mono/diheme cytochrome c family protein